MLPVTGSALGPDLGWTISDALNGLTAIPNLIALIALSGVVVAETEQYLAKQGGEAADTSQAVQD